MRTDAIIDRHDVHLRNSTLIGFSKRTGSFGDFVVWKDAELTRFARIVGRVKYAPELGSKANNTYTPEIKNYLMLIVLNSSISNLFIRWVSPDEITECYSPADYLFRIKQTFDNFTSNSLLENSPNEIADELAK